LSKFGFTKGCLEKAEIIDKVKLVSYDIVKAIKH